MNTYSRLQPLTLVDRRSAGGVATWLTCVWVGACVCRNLWLGVVAGMGKTNFLYYDCAHRARQKYWSKYCWCSLMWLMPLRSLSNCDYELNFYLRLILGPIHSNQVMGTDPVGSYHGTRNSRSNSVNPTYRYQSHD